MANRVNLLGAGSARTDTPPVHAPGTPRWLIDRATELKQQGRPVEAADLMLEAARHYVADEFLLKGLALLRQVLQLDPGRTAVHREIFFVLQQLILPGDEPLAMEAFRAGCARIPELRPKGERLRLRDAAMTAPNDASLRRVMADWLLEQGDPQGEAMQLEHHDPKDPRLVALREQHQGAWLHELRPLLLRWELRDTLVESATLSADVYLEHRDVLFAAAPLLRLHLVERDEQELRYFESALEGPDRLRITGLIRVGARHYLDVMLPRLLQLAPRAGHLTHLALPRCHISAEGMFALLKAFPWLKELDLRQNPITGVEKLPAVVRL